MRRLLEILGGAIHEGQVPPTVAGWTARWASTATGPSARVSASAPRTSRTSRRVRAGAAVSDAGGRGAQSGAGGVYRISP
jgi:hypothetical protein